MALELRKKSTKTEQSDSSQSFAKASFASRADTAGGECPYCGATYSSTAQICPQCGMGVGAGTCTFCGSAMPAGADNCPHCGNPASGLECPECGTINFRNFCRKCGESLNGRGQMALQRFKADPKYKEVERKAIELQRLQDFIEGKTESIEFDADTAGQKEAKLDTEALTEMPDAYAALFAAKAQPGSRSNVQKATQAQTKPHTESQKAAPKIVYDTPKPATAAQRMSVKEAIKLYQSKKAEMDAILDSIVPPPELTPEEQRDFCSARQIVVRYTQTITRTTTRRYWICNYCGCKHGAPPECAEPWHGGQWITEDNTETETITTKSLETLD